MFDGSDLPLKENLDIAVKLLERCRRNELILEIEAWVVGGEEDGIKAEAALAERVKQGVRELRGVGSTLYQA